MAEAAENLEPEGSPLDLATDQAIEACDGDAWATVRALLVANAALEEEVARLAATTSKGYSRGRVRRTARPA